MDDTRYDRIDPWTVWSAALETYSTRSGGSLLTVLTTFPEDTKDTIRAILGQMQERLNAPPWDR